MGDSDEEPSVYYDEDPNLGGNQRLVSMVNSITEIKENKIKRLCFDDIKSFGGCENKNYLYKDELDLYKIYKGNLRGVEVMIKWFNTEQKNSFLKKKKKKMVKVMFDNKREVFTDSDFEVCFCSEVRAQVIIKHENIVEGYGFCHENCLVVMHEAMPEGTLHSSLHSRSKSLDFEKRWKISVEIASAIEYLHNSKDKVLHRDITSKNVWLTSDSKSKLTSFMYAKFTENEVREDALVFRLPRQKGIEFIREGLCTEVIDIVFFGILLLEIATGMDRKDILRKILQTADKFKADRKLGNNYNREIWSHLIIAGLECCGPNHSTRPSSMTEVVRSLKKMHSDMGQSSTIASSSNISDMEQSSDSIAEIPDDFCPSDNASNEDLTRLAQTGLRILYELNPNNEIDVTALIRQLTNILTTSPATRLDLQQCILSHYELLKDSFEKLEKLGKEL